MPFSRERVTDRPSWHVVTRRLLTAACLEPNTQISEDVRHVVVCLSHLGETAELAVQEREGDAETKRVVFFAGGGVQRNECVVERIEDDHVPVCESKEPFQPHRHVDRADALVCIN